MKHRQLSPDGVSSGTGFENLSENDFLDLEEQEAKPAAAASEEKSDAEKAAQEQTDKLAASDADAKTKAEEAAKVAETPEQIKAKEEEALSKMSETEKAEHLAKKEKEEIEKEFKLPTDKKEDGEDEDSNWLNVSKKLDIDLKEDSFEAFETAYKTKIETVRKEEKALALKSKWTEEIISLPVEAQATIIGLKNGMSLEEVTAPLKRLEELKVMDDADLIALDFKGQGYDDEYVEMKIAKLAENGDLELTAKEIRKVISDSEKEIKDNHLTRIKEIDENNKKLIQETRDKETASIKEKLGTIKQFMDTPVSEKVVNYLVKNWEQGKYHEDFKNPDLLAEFLIYKEFGEQGIKNMKQKAYERGRDEKANKLHNIPPVIKSGGSTTKSGEATSPIGNFGALDHLMED